LIDNITENTWRDNVVLAIFQGKVVDRQQRAKDGRTGKGFILIFLIVSNLSVKTNGAAK